MFYDIKCFIINKICFHFNGFIAVNDFGKLLLFQHLLQKCIHDCTDSCKQQESPAKLHKLFSPVYL